MPHLTTYLVLADRAEATLAESFRTVAEGHARAADVFHTCHALAGMCDAHRERLGPVLRRIDEADADDVDLPERLHADGLAQVRAGEIGLLRDLQDLHVLVDLVLTTWSVIAQGAQGLRDHELLDLARAAAHDGTRQRSWLDTRLKAAAPQALIVAP